MVIPGLGHPYIKLWEVILSFAGPSHYELPQEYSFHNQLGINQLVVTINWEL